MHIYAFMIRPSVSATKKKTARCNLYRTASDERKAIFYIPVLYNLSVTRRINPVSGTIPEICSKLSGVFPE